MGKKKGISFIVTVFNKEKFIQHTLKSIYENLEKNSELIIVNDGSTDNSLSIINKFLKTNPNVNSKIINQENTGPSRAINKALKYVKYSHIKMVDGDDILAPNITAFMFSEMIRLNLDLLYGHWVWDENHFNYKFNKEYSSAFYFQNPFKKIFLSGWGGFSNLMIKTSTIEEVGGCDENVFIQDYSLPLRVAGYHYKNKNLKPFNIGLTKRTICVAPEFIENRIITNNAQTLHDLSIASINFLNNHNNVPTHFKKELFKKIIRRCWKWKKKNKVTSYFSWDFYNFIKSYIYIYENLDVLKLEVINTWKNEKKIRVFEDNEKTFDILVYVGLDLLGDALIKLPFIRNLKIIFPKSNITWLAGKGASTLNSSLKVISKSLIDKIIDNANVGSKFTDLFKKILPEKDYDIVIDTQKRVLTTLVIKKIKTKVFISPSAGYFFSDVKSNTCKEENLAKELVKMSLLLTYKKETKLKQIPINKYKKKIHDFLVKYPGKKVAICPGASISWKRWSVEKFIEVSEFLIQKKFLPVFFLGPNEKDYFPILKKKFPFASFPLQTEVKKISPVHTILFARLCDFGISNDTGCGHLLATADIPIISLFGRTNSKKFAPYNLQENIVISSRNYSNSSDIKMIPVKSVITAIQNIIK